MTKLEKISFQLQIKLIRQAKHLIHPFHLLTWITWIFQVSISIRRLLKNYSRWQWFEDYYNAPTCPHSPGLSLKNASLTSNNSNLSPPPPSPSTTPHLSLNSKRRGLNHRASYKRAHTGRLVSRLLRVFFQHLWLSINNFHWSLWIILRMNCLSNCKN